MEPLALGFWAGALPGEGGHQNTTPLGRPTANEVLPLTPHPRSIHRKGGMQASMGSRSATLQVPQAPPCLEILCCPQHATTANPRGPQADPRRTNRSCCQWSPLPSTPARLDVCLPLYTHERVGPCMNRTPIGSGGRRDHQRRRHLVGWHAGLRRVLGFRFVPGRHSHEDILAFA
jgi:hypothetical protein